MGEGAQVCRWGWRQSGGGVGGNRAVGGNSGGVSSGGGVGGLQPLRTAVHTISIRLQNCLS